MGGPWAYVPGRELPADFAWIPDDSPKENVKASVPGTPQAREAHIANSIPQTATVKRSEAKLTGLVIDGAPKMSPISGTPLQYVVNSATPIIVVDPHSYYALQNGVWFVGTAVSGPWVVATSVPAVIYSIPPSSPVHYVSYVRVYDWTSQVVYVGYTPGYYGTYVDSDGVVVYGTGYYYTPWIGTVWYGPPVTYGVAAAVTYTPWTGWAYGHPRAVTIDLLEKALASAPRTPPRVVPVAAGVKNFEGWEITAPIYATGWDSDVIVTLPADGPATVKTRRPRN